MPITLRLLKKIGALRARCGSPSVALSEKSKQSLLVSCTRLSSNAFSYLETPSSKQVARPEAFRCYKSNPVDHTIDDEALFYKIPKADFNVICPPTGSQKAFIRRHVAEMESFHESCIMIRRPALEVIGCMKSADYSLPALRYLIYGDAGTGKSITLQHITHYCMKQGWLILPTLFAWDWVRYKSHYKIVQKEELLESMWNKERYDLPVRATAWLETFRTMNKEHLANIKTSKEYIWTKRDKTEAGKSLGTLVDQGIARPRLSTDVIGCVMREIRVRPPLIMPRVLVSVDCVNALFSKTWYKAGLKGFVKADELSFIHNLKKLMREPWTNGAVLVATNGTYTLDANQEERIREGQYTYEVLGHKAFDVLDPHIPIEVANYCDKEMRSQLAYYEDRKWLVGRATTDKGQKEIIQVSCNNPWELAKFCSGAY